MTDITPEIDVSLEAAKAIAQGMMKLAASDGVHPKEVQLIKGFMAECYELAGGTETYEELSHEDFDLEHVKAVLNTDELRELFMKSNLLLACADGVYSESEQNMMDHYAIEMGMTAGRLRELEMQVKQYMLGQFAGVKVYRDQAEELGRKLGMPPDAIERALGIREELAPS